MTSFERVKRFLKWAFSGKARKDFRKDLENRKFEKFRLLMLMVVRDEEDIIRQNILFHKEMGVDGFIITSHNSVDRTNIILEDLRKKGVVLDILYKTDPKHQHGVWVKEMITLARDVYHADWVIHADADEFFYSRQQNIKKSIFEFDKWNFNVLKVKAVSLFPDGRNDFLTCPYFVSNFLSPPLPQEKDICTSVDELFGSSEQFRHYVSRISEANFPKVMHKIKGYKRSLDGNHSVRMSRKKEMSCGDISLYHYNVKNYKGYEKRVLRWKDSIQYLEPNQGMHMRNQIMLYQNGELRKDYEDLYSPQKREYLIKYGMVIVDYSISAFLKKKNIIL